MDLERGLQSLPADLATPEGGGLKSALLIQQQCTLVLSPGEGTLMSRVGKGH